jgi:nucleotide-binding universal stress UspA family protein
VAWDGSAQAGRAARAALPLLQAAASVLILRNVDDRSSESDTSDVARLEAYLQSHGVKQIKSSALHGERVADSLLAAARAAKCELLVAGAFGRPRLFEMALGGTTRSLVQATGGPNVLLAH